MRYWGPGPGEGAQGAGQVAARNRGRRGGEEQGNGGRNGDAEVRLHGKTETGRRMTVRALMTAEEWSGRWGHDAQLSSNRDREERRGAGQGDRKAKSEGWRVRSEEASDEETEEDSIPTGEQEGSEDTLTASPWGTQESGAGGHTGIRGNEGRSCQR